VPAGITVLVFDSLASAPCEYNLADNFSLYGQEEAQLVGSCMHGTGNVIVAQGVGRLGAVGGDLHQQLAELKMFPKIKIASTVVARRTIPRPSRPSLVCCRASRPYRG